MGSITNPRIYHTAGLHGTQHGTDGSLRAKSAEATSEYRSSSLLVLWFGHSQLVIVHAGHLSDSVVTYVVVALGRPDKPDKPDKPVNFSSLHSAIIISIIIGCHHFGDLQFTYRLLT